MGRWAPAEAAPVGFNRFLVVAGLVPAIPSSASSFAQKDVDPRVKPTGGDDGMMAASTCR
jgi:hypothetical protein